MYDKAPPALSDELGVWQKKCLSNLLPDLFPPDVVYRSKGV